MPHIPRLSVETVWRATVGLSLCFAAHAAPARAAVPHEPNAPPYPILFVTQVPFRPDFTTIGAVFGNHKPGMDDVGRGGDLWIRYPDGSLKNLTQAAGLGNSGLQTETAIAVRDPSPYWDGTKALFSMVVGAPRYQYDYANIAGWRWQMYEITGLGPTDTPVITKVPNQPTDYNNITPIYTSDDQIIFTTDRPRNGAAHLWPQRDEYELAPTVSGVWKLNPATGGLQLLNHAPSGDFTPMIDSYGRVVFTQWDHLQRDQQADGDTVGSNCHSPGTTYGTFNYSDESANATYNLNVRDEIFPEPRSCRNDLLDGTNIVGHTLNHFFPWTIREDGTESEILNHLGRHELHSYIERSFNDDPNLIEFYGQFSRFNPNSILNFLHIEESPVSPGTYYGVDAPEFGTHAGGRVISMTAPPSLDADHIAVTDVTDPALGNARDPLPLSDGSIIVAHTSQTGQENGGGGVTASSYDYRLKSLVLSGTIYVAGAPLTSGISKTVQWWTPDYFVSYSGNLWEWMPTELRPRARPSPPTTTLETPEAQLFAQAQVSESAFRKYLRDRNLAVAVVRDATTRDDADLQQPYRLRVVHDGVTGTQTLTGTGKIYDIEYMQLFQADQLRGWTGCCGITPFAGRRVLAQFLHDPWAQAIQSPTTGPTATVNIALDGSVAAFVPANRAMTWQLTNGDVPVVRERYWITFQPGEIRVCTSCHGLSSKDQAGQLPPQNSPQALLSLLEWWKSHTTFQVFVPNVMRDVTGAW